MAIWLLIGIFALAAAEIAVLALVAAALGLAPALVLLSATALAGLIVLPLRAPGSNVCASL